MLSENIRHLRTEKDLTQDELAKRAQVPYVTVTKIERGIVKNPRMWTLIKIAKGLEVSLDELTTDT